MLITEPGNFTLSVIDRHTLAGYLAEALRATLFDNRLTITSQDVVQIADAIARAFQLYQRDDDGDDLARTLGRRLAQEGLGHTSALAVVETLHHFAWELCETQPSAGAITTRYCVCLLAGYMAAREAYLLRERARTYLAIERVRGDRAAEASA